MRLVSIEEKHGEYIITVKEGLFLRKTTKYIGSVTVWRRLPDFKRAGTFKESILCDFWMKYCHDEIIRITSELKKARADGVVCSSEEFKCMYYAGKPCKRAGTNDCIQ